VNCFGACDGQALVIGNGGTTPNGSVYSWSDPTIGNTANATNLCAGVFTVTGSDDNGCWADTTFTIAEPNGFIIATSVITSTCNQPDGIAAVDAVSGGVPAYTDLWYAASGGGTNSLATGLIPGTYMVTIADANTCDTTISITMPNAPGVVGSLASSTNTSCFQMCDATADATATGGTAPSS
jgi:hypothetical protein